MGKFALVRFAVSLVVSLFGAPIIAFLPIPYWLIFIVVLLLGYLWFFNSVIKIKN